MSSIQSRNACAFGLRLAGRIEQQRPGDGIDACFLAFSTVGAMPGSPMPLGNLEHLHARHGVSHAAVADRAGRIGHQRHDVHRAVLVDRAQLVLAVLAHHRLAKVDIRAGAVLAADADDRVAAAAVGIDAQLRPAGDLSAFAVDFGEVLQRDRIQRVVLVDVDRQGIVADDDFARVGVPPLPVRARFLRVFHLPAGVGHVAVAVDQAGDAHARTAAGNLNDRLGMAGVVVFRPRLCQVDHRVRAFDTHPFGGRSAARQRGQEQSAN